METDEERFYTRLVKLYCAIKEIDIPPKDLVVLVKFCVYGINESTKKFLLDEKILKSDQQYRNIQSFLYKAGLIIKEGRSKYRVNDSLQLKERIAVMIGLDCEAYNVVKNNSETELV